MIYNAHFSKILKLFMVDKTDDKKIDSDNNDGNKI
jgi:hypothetical protein